MSPPLQVVLVAIGPSEPGDGLVAGVRALQDAGARVALVSRRPPSAALVAVLDSVLPLPAGGPLSGVLAGAGRLAGRLPKVRLDPDRLPAARRLRRDPVTRALLGSAQVLVAVDQAAIPAVWLAARRSAHPVAALSGLPAAVTRYAG